MSNTAGILALVAGIFFILSSIAFLVIGVQFRMPLFPSSLGR